MRRNPIEPRNPLEEEHNAARCPSQLVAIDSVPRWFAMDSPNDRDILGGVETSEL